MRIVRVAFGFTKNLGNYESMRVDATVELAEDEDFDSALQLACAVVNEAIDRPLTHGEAIALGRERARAALAVESRS